MALILSLLVPQASLAFLIPEGYTYLIIHLEAAIARMKSLLLMLLFINANMEESDSDMSLGLPNHWNPPFSPIIRHGPVPKLLLV